VENGPVSAPTDIRGIAKIPLSGGTKPGDLVKLYLLTPANGLVFISPWDQEVIVPSHSSTLLSVVIASQGDPALLKNSTALTALTENVLKQMQPRKNSEPVSAWQRESLARVSRIYGFEAGHLDHAIRAWGGTTEDPYEQGLVALYEKRYHD